MLKFDKTARGFGRIEFTDHPVTTFTDRYGEKCSLQESSLATEAAIWFGTEGTIVQGPPWEDVEVPDNWLVTSRMHLTQAMVAHLIPLLQHFVDTGELPEIPTRRRSNP